MKTKLQKLVKKMVRKPEISKLAQGLLFFLKFLTFFSLIKPAMRLTELFPKVNQLMSYLIVSRQRQFEI